MRAQASSRGKSLQALADSEPSSKLVKRTISAIRGILLPKDNTAVLSTAGDCGQLGTRGWLDQYTWRICLFLALFESPDARPKAFVATLCHYVGIRQQTQGWALCRGLAVQKSCADKRRRKVKAAFASSADRERRWLGVLYTHFTTKADRPSEYLDGAVALLLVKPKPRYPAMLTTRYVSLCAMTVQRALGSRIPFRLKPS
jgi:hypothetical protein